MDWKPYYRAELEREDTRIRLEDALGSASRGRAVDRLLEGGAVLSFPHTAAQYAGPLQSGVVAALYRRQPSLVIALGVLHLSGHRAYRVAASAAETHARRREAFRVLAGGLVAPESRVSTPFGPLDLAPLAGEVPGVLRRDREGTLKDEFSLDLFLALVRLYADLEGVPQLRILPIYVGMTRDPGSGSFDQARRLASAVAGLAGPETATVTTGDLVHFGHTYDQDERIETMPSDLRSLSSFFRSETEEALDLALTRGDQAGAFERCERILHSDQRYVLPVLAELLGSGARFDVLEFSLSDYSSILGVEPPALVASALVSYQRAA